MHEDEGWTEREKEMEEEKVNLNTEEDNDEEKDEMRRMKAKKYSPLKSLFCSYSY